MNLNLGGMKLSKNIEIYIDDTPSDFSAAQTFDSDEEYEKYWERRKKEIDEEAKQ